MSVMDREEVLLTVAVLAFTSAVLAVVMGLWLTNWLTAGVTAALVFGVNFAGAWARSAMRQRVGR